MRKIERVCIVGAGSIGSLYAGHLADVAEVKILTRREDHARRLNRDGLRVSGKSLRQAEVVAATDPAALGEVDLVILATKTNHVQQSAGALRNCFPGALVMLCQNGMGCESLVAQYGAWPILSAVTFMGGTRLDDNHVEYELDTATWIAPWKQGSATLEDARAVEQLLHAAGLKAQAFADLLPAQWSKLIFNATVNGISAITGLPVCREFIATERLSDLGHLVFETMEEGKRVAVACGVNLHEDPAAMLRGAVSQFEEERSDGKVPSMLADVRAKQPTEVDWINGAIVRAARDVGLEAPLNAALYRLIKAIERGWQGRIF